MGLGISAGSSLRPAEVITSELRCKGTTFFKRFQAYSFPFKLVQRFYGRTSKHPQDVRPYPLRTYVHRPFERTSKHPIDVRP